MRIVLSMIFLIGFSMRMAFSFDVMLAWDPSASTRITGYRVYYGKASRVYETFESVGITNTHTVFGLPTGRWFFAVTAYDAEGNESDFSNEVSTEGVSIVYDINGDGKVNVIDMQLLATEISKGIVVLSRDYNGDGKVNALDLRALVNVVLGKTVP